jgi:hypothetical protein
MLQLGLRGGKSQHTPAFMHSARRSRLEFQIALGLMLDKRFSPTMHNELFPESTSASTWNAHRLWMGRTGELPVKYDIVFEHLRQAAGCQLAELLEDASVLDMQCRLDA